MPRGRLCLPTGATPAPVYHAFAAGGGDLTSATVFLLDEFGLPSGAPARCDTMLGRDLLDRLAAPPHRVVTWDTDADDLGAMCNAFDADVADGGLDLVVLGIGGNGHLGINEPGTPRDAPTRLVELHETTAAATDRYGADDRPAWGVTLGMARILEGREVWLLATGAHKAAIVRAACRGPVGPHVPASYLQTHPNVKVWLDEPAASAL